MDPSQLGLANQANSRERSQQTIDAEIESLEKSLRASKLCRNALSPSHDLALRDNEHTVARNIE